MANNKIEKEYQCSKCKKSYNHSNSLSYHYQTQHEDSTFECELCKKSFSSKGVRENHKKSVHYATDEICKLCQKSIKRMKSHIEDVHGNRAWKCDKCDKIYRSAGSLSNHKATTHNGKVPKSICDACGQGFNRRNDLFTHRKNEHAGEKIYKCDKAFTRLHSRNRHIKLIHIGQKFPCKNCDEVFSQRYFLNKYSHKRSTYGLSRRKMQM